jgi:lipopolysaccharide transport system permease protein
MRIKVTTYEPDNLIKKGYLQIFREIYSEIRSNRWLIYQLFRRDFVTGYRQSLFGVLWAFIVPIVSVVAFLLLNQSGLLVLGNLSAPYPVYALLGLAIWQLFSTGIIAGSYSLVQAGYMISKINFSKKALVIASLGKTLVTFVIQLGLVFASFVLLGFVPTIWILLIPFLVIPIVLATLGLSFLFSILNGIIRDFGSLLSMLTTFVLFGTPILYSRPDIGLLSQVTTYNPLYYLISVPRDLALTGNTSEWLGFIVSSVLGITIFLFSLIVFHLTEARLAERI